LETERNLISVITPVRELFFASRIRAIVEGNGCEFVQVRSEPEVHAAIKEHENAVIVLDLESKDIDAAKLIEQIRAGAHHPDIPVLGFFSHLNVEARKRADAAGLTISSTRSVFATRLTELLQKTQHS
jgi:CheY-like chemotaxis protein